MEENGSGHEDSSHNMLTLDALQVLSRSQGNLNLSMSMRIRPICKNLHTYATEDHDSREQDVRLICDISTKSPETKSRSVE
jgi:hypothetical protein